MAGSSTISSTDTRINAFQVQTSAYGIALPIGWGRNRLKSNLYWYGDFKAIPATSTSSGGGKGGGVKQQNTTYSYQASIILGLCEGPIQGIRTVFVDKSVFVDGVTTALAQAGLSLALGTLGQPVWSHLTTNHPDEAIGYSRIAYAYAVDYPLSSSATLGNHSFEVDFEIQGPGDLVDAVPRDILVDFLTNPSHGLPMWKDGLIGDLGDWADYTLAEGLLLSPLLDSQRMAADFVKELMQASNSEVVWSEGLLKVKPYGDQEITGNGVTWTPNLTPVYDLTDDDFHSDDEGQDPVRVEIGDQTDAYNVVQFEFLNRAHQYNVETLPAQDLANIQEFGKRKGDPISMHSICDIEVARKAVQLFLQDVLYIRDRYHFQLPWNFVLLEPMDIVTLTDSGLGLDRTPVRIEEIQEDEEGMLTFVAKELQIGTASAPLYDTQSTGGFESDYNVDPGDSAYPLLFNPPSSITETAYEVWVAVAGVGDYWGGCEVWVSLDGTNYEKVGEVLGGARYGELTAVLPIEPDPDLVDTLSLDLTISRGELLPATQADVDAAVNLCWIEGELIAYRDSTLVSPYNYDLDYLRRGQNQTPIVSHAIGSSFVRLDRAIFKYSFLEQQIGQVVYAKFPSFNVYGQSLQQLSDATAYTITLDPHNISPATVTGIQLLYPFENTYFTLVWPVTPAISGYRVDVYQSDGTTLLRTLNTLLLSFTYTLADAQADSWVERTYVVKVTPYNPAGDGTAMTITPVNAVPPMVTGVGDSGAGTSRFIYWTNSGVADLAGYVAYYSTTPGFDPTTGGGTQFYMGPDIGATLNGLTPTTVYYVRVAAYDTWDTTIADLNFSAEHSFTA